ncbi:MAG TPA: STAS domain-containing protein [Steroidobacteraceae bacterium]|nr:STAS domain-containing protein [Steroidobacteraceae bacterium]
MKTRKHHTQVRKRARRLPAKRTAAQHRPAAARGKTAPGSSTASRLHAADGSLALAAECTAAEADALKSDLSRRLDDPQPVTVDVSALERVDTAGLQLLAAFVRDRRVAGRAVRWRGRATPLGTAARLLGLNDMLELPGEVG